MPTSPTNKIYGDSTMMHEGDKAIATGVGITVLVLIGIMFALIVIANIVG